MKKVITVDNKKFEYIGRVIDCQDCHNSYSTSWQGMAPKKCRYCGSINIKIRKMLVLINNLSIVQKQEFVKEI